VGAEVRIGNFVHCSVCGAVYRLIAVTEEVKSAAKGRTTTR